MNGVSTTLLARLVYSVRDLPVWLTVAGCVLLLGVAQRHLGHAYRTLDELTIQRAQLQAIAAEVSAWNAMEQRLKVVRTWPYNTEMLRTLFLSALGPLLLALARQVGALLMR